ncbi:hypothetical protein NIES267_07130 [Calothrix parasitica NIES-267]|uniref:Uncharacterized protein n=1 Tax=Calothrix parasitica NIES-267 TaxID=1973488 RepID=A0A1Z4LJG6_9CYAN|nr:hypothetical protein NIES267_07130 [Calothrix parasitica NIES-267]
MSNIAFPILLRYTLKPHPDKAALYLPSPGGRRGVGGEVKLHLIYLINAIGNKNK